MSYRKITDSDLHNVGVIGLPDTPELSKEEMQAKFEETVRSVVIPAFNQLIGQLEERDSKTYTSDEIIQLINQRVMNIGAGDMAMGVYDKDNDGVVDNAAQLAGHGPEYFATKESVAGLTQSVSAIVVVDSLPQLPDENTLYLIPK